ncbi:(2,3-dihydroxybenzoyl)adenylate synthase [Pseudomonas sp. NCCP-436]|uniref:(2,3-dihydroxybenzoyl)adenylate synthase n=1 Tax=Pseudomonas sp. NCCP-436 TaxID=2842481 RepID=UPI001C7FD04D|nr:(2,3-dihydroxybenzoyl)adenylate synthase [Pseudomonas sp. NCCP-436]GIZ12523.1 2,3-dihydroxybenzoate-AMP ligase [Pseudomonas sp. NCCP-436]
MSIEFTRWPEPRARRYRELGYWIGQPLSRILEIQAHERPEAPAIICGERIFSYALLDQLSGNLASRLLAGGMRRGDTALVQLPNVAEFYIVLFALLKAGIVPLNALYSHRQLELGHYVGQIRPRLLIASASHEVLRDDSWLQGLRDAGQAPERVLLLGESALGERLEDWMQAPARQALACRPGQPDEVALFQLSGGSTGTPKLIPRTHDDYCFNARRCAEVCALSERTRFLCALPAAHNFVLSSPGALGVFHAGGCVVLAASPDPQLCFPLIARHGVNVAALVPSAVVLWLEAAAGDREALRSLEVLQVGGASFAEALARRVPQVLGCRLQQVFGMAEGLISYTRLDDPPEQIFTTQGRPICADDEIRILDENGQPLPDGVSGMLATRGPYTFCGYYASPEQNARAFDAEGFYLSGDLVRRTADGFLQVVGRVKDQINRGGEKIAAEEVEHLLLQHPQVSQAALVAMPDERLGERSCAFIVASANALKAPMLRRHLLELGIAEYKLPDRIRLLDAMPHTAVGKIDKQQLRRQLALEANREWLAERVRQLVEDGEELDPAENLIFYGLDSLRVMNLAAELKARGIAVSFEELARTPTLQHWQSLLETRQTAG